MLPFDYAATDKISAKLGESANILESVSSGLNGFEVDLYKCYAEREVLNQIQVGIIEEGTQYFNAQEKLPQLIEQRDQERSKCKTICASTIQQLQALEAQRNKQLVNIDSTIKSFQDLLSQVPKISEGRKKG
jgi:hypothetical protein